MSERAGRHGGGGEEISDWASRTGELPALSGDGIDVLSTLLRLFQSEEARFQIGEILGDSFFSVLRAAPRDFAVVSLIAHGAIIPGVLPVLVFLSSSQDGGFLEPDQAEGFLDRLIDPLVPWLAAANYSECEFCGVKASSWHVTAFRFIVRSLEIAKCAIAEAQQRVAELRPDMFGQDVPQHATAIVLESVFEFPPPEIDIRKYLENMRSRLSPAFSAIRTLAQEFDGDQHDAIDCLALRMQQELPRAWSLKYGCGNTDFPRIEESILSVIETISGGGRAVAPRNRLFLKWKKEEGLGTAAIRDRWNEMSQDQRRGIAPRAAGKMTYGGVKKAIQRELSRSARPRL